MAITRGPHLERILAEAERLTRARPMPPAPLRARLRSSPGLRRLAPRSLIVAAAQSRGRALWRRDPETRRYTTAMMETVVTGTARAGEAKQLACQYLAEQAAEQELFWLPWRLPALDRRSREHADRALASGRGVLISSCHTSAIYMTCWPISELGRRVYLTAAPWYFGEPGNDYWGRRLVRFRREVAKRNELVLPAPGSFPMLRQLLEWGEVVNVLFDMPGGTATNFLGKPVMLSSGSARLAAEADALVLPVRTRRVGADFRVDVCAPLDPRAFDDHEELHRSLAAIHERHILEQPQALEDPNRPGAWEGVASTCGWANPRYSCGGSILPKLDGKAAIAPPFDAENAQRIAWQQRRDRTSRASWPRPNA
jgi:lauroyl/myristoyl acyltransferase